MLKNIPSVMSAELMHVLMSMGHGDEIVLADGNFPAASCAQRLVVIPGHGVPVVLEAILRFLPLDTYVTDSAVVMGVVPGDPTIPVIWDDYRRLLSAAEGRDIALAEMERSAFYQRARQAFAIVATSEPALYANLILKKGVVTDR
ncbi:MAG: RbsD/FucU family protein [Armatimonadota bacterium]